MNVLIVGGGVFGQVIAARLRRDHINVTVFDRREKENGSAPSGGHLKPSWLEVIPREDLDRSMELLSELYGMQTLECKFLLKTVELHRVDIETVLAAPVVEQDVIHIGDGYVGTQLGRWEGTVIVAAGIWSRDLLPGLASRMSARKGMSQVFTNPSMFKNKIVPWAPYKQIVITEHGKGKLWIGDGTAIKPENWTAGVEAKIQSRVKPHVPKTYDQTIIQRGIRPYIDGEGCARVGEKLWYATGGGKSGTALAGWYANRIGDALTGKVRMPAITPIQHLLTKRTLF